ncbi:sigma-70 family RNA polymerase sigma factor [Salibacterium sp. K-3]
MEHVPAGLFGRCGKLDQFIMDHPSVWKHSVMQQFLSDTRRRELLIEAICTPTTENQAFLNEAFTSFYTEIRFVSYILKTLHWRSVRYDQQRQQRSVRQPLILDQPVSQGSLETIKETIVSADVLPALDEASGLQEAVGHPLLHKGLNQLTTRQQAVLQKKYKEEKTDKAIAAEWNISQQAVSKTRQAALEKLRIFMKRGNSG